MANLAVRGNVPGARTAVNVWRALGTARRYPVFPVAILLFVLVLPAIFAGWVAPHDPVVGSLSERLAPPFWVEAEGEGIYATPGGTTKHLLGTDKQGRDILSRIVYGARVSLTVAAISIFLAGTIGTILGMVAGYFGGNIDHVVMRAVDICLSMPAILFALVLAVVLGPSFQTVIIVIVTIFWSRYARLVRGETLSIKAQDFVARAKVAGASNVRIIFRHVFPNIVNTIIVLATLEVGQVILLESTLSFLGAGLPRPTPAWGLMVADGRELLVTSWWLTVWPGTAILLSVLSMNLLGDWLRDRLDPKLRNV
ncbi:MAG: ABC transporter permease [Chloroflexota bacterium]|nr:ABC transporter permease [Chloroflexota bacterium]